MIKAERQKKITEILNEESYISVNKLSKMLFISLPTVRRDLSELEKKGIIVRSHGGAMAKHRGSYELPLEFRSNFKITEKLDMCKKAAKLIKEGDVIFIDASTSVMHIADYIDKKNITAVTNGMPAAILLAKKNIKAHCVGGEVLPSSLGFGGRHAELYAAGFNFDIAFFSSFGVNRKGMIVDTSFAETNMRKTVFKNTKKTVFLFDKTKENADAPYNVMKLCDVDIVISE